MDENPAADEAEIDFGSLNGAEMTALLDTIPGAHERLELGLAQARAGQTIPLEEL